MDLSLFASSQGTELEMKKKQLRELVILLLIIWKRISFYQVWTRWAASAEGRLKPGEV